MTVTIPWPSRDHPVTIPWPYRDHTVTIPSKERPTNVRGTFLPYWHRFHRCDTVQRSWPYTVTDRRFRCCTVWDCFETVLRPFGIVLGPFKTVRGSFMGSKSIVTRLVFLQKTVNITKKNKIFFIKYLKSNMQHQIKFGQRNQKIYHSLVNII